MERNTWNTVCYSQQNDFKFLCAGWETVMMFINVLPASCSEMRFYFEGDEQRKWCGCFRWLCSVWSGSARLGSAQYGPAAVVPAVVNLCVTAEERWRPLLSPVGPARRAASGTAQPWPPVGSRTAASGPSSTSGRRPAWRTWTGSSRSSASTTSGSTTTSGLWRSTRPRTSSSPCWVRSKHTDTRSRTRRLAGRRSGLRGVVYQAAGRRRSSSIPHRHTDAALFNTENRLKTSGELYPLQKRAVMMLLCLLRLLHLCTAQPGERHLQRTLGKQVRETQVTWCCW